MSIIITVRLLNNFKDIKFFGNAVLMAVFSHILMQITVAFRVRNGYNVMEVVWIL